MEGHGGRIPAHCFGGCTVRAICAGIGIKISELFTVPGTSEAKPAIVVKSEKQIADLRSRLTPRERVLPVTIVYCDEKHLDAGIARVLALAVEGEIVQAILEKNE